MRPVIKCPKCGHKLTNGQAQCIYCGFVPGDVASSDSLEDLSEDLRKKIEEAIKQGGGSATSESYTQAQDIFSVLSLPKTPRRARMHPLILALIFFASASIVGFIFWLIM